MIARKPVNFGGRLFMPGESVKGALPLDMIEQLQANGFIGEADEVDQPSVETEGAEDEGDLSLEEFAALKADAQKERLAKLNIEPGSNADQRLEQYQAWLDREKEGSHA